MARPAKLTPELTREISTYISDGNSPTISVTLVGISPSTYFNWMRKGANKEPGFMEFLESIERAKAQSIINRVARITKAAEDGHWRAAAWLLERMAPKSYGKHRAITSDPSSQRFEEPQGVSIQKLEESVRQILEQRSQLPSNSTMKFIQPTQTKEIRGN